jgi:hypothetical protein
MHKRKSRRSAQNMSVSKPGVFSLLVNILKGTFFNGMQLPALFCIGLIAALYYAAYPYHAAISGLLAIGLLFIGLLRGCSNWQRDMVEYRRELTNLYHEQQLGEANRKQAIPGFIPYTHIRR